MGIAKITFVITHIYTIMIPGFASSRIAGLARDFVMDFAESKSPELSIFQVCNYYTKGKTYIHIHT